MLKRALLLLLAACGTPAPSLDPDVSRTPGEQLTTIPEGTIEAAAALRVANEALQPQLEGFGLDVRAAANIVWYRVGDDGVGGTEDDAKLETLAELDAIPFVTGASIDLLLAAARTLGYLDLGPGTSQPTWADLPTVGAPSHSTTLKWSACAVTLGDAVLTIAESGESRRFYPAAAKWGAGIAGTLPSANLKKRVCAGDGPRALVLTEMDLYNSGPFLAVHGIGPGDAWIDLPSFGSTWNLRAFAAAFIEGKPVVILQYPITGPGPNGVEQYELNGNAWRKIATAPSIRFDEFTIVADGKALYAWDGKQGVRFENGAATVLPAAPNVGEKEPGATVIGGKLFAWAAKATFDPSTSQWTSFSALQRPSLSGCQTLAFNDGRFAYVAPSACTGAARWDPTTDAWRDLPDTARFGGGIPAFAAGHIVSWKWRKPAEGRFIAP